jgi:HEAT repeats
MNAVSICKQSIRFAPFLLLICMLAYTMLTLPPGEPCYQKKPLHYWLSRTHNQSLPPEEQNRTRTAVTSIGTNNLPLLLHWFREEEPPDTEPAYQKAANWLLSHQRLSSYRLESDYRPSRPSMAMWVFMDYPNVATQAIPQLIACLSEKNNTIKGKAAFVLGKIGLPAMPAIIPALSDTNDLARALAAWVVGEIGTNAIYVRPKIEAMLNDQSIAVRLNSAVSLGKLGGNAETVVTVLLRGVHEGDRDARIYALDCLGKMKNRALSAVPDLTNSIARTTNSEDRMLLISALEDIAPEQSPMFDPSGPSEPPAPSESTNNRDHR